MQIPKISSNRIKSFLWANYLPSGSTKTWILTVNSDDSWFSRVKWMSINAKNQTHLESWAGLLNTFTLWSQCQYISLHFFARSRTSFFTKLNNYQTSVAKQKCSVDISSFYIKHSHGDQCIVFILLTLCTRFYVHCMHIYSSLIGMIESMMHSSIYMIFQIGLSEG